MLTVNAGIVAPPFVTGGVKTFDKEVGTWQLGTDWAQIASVRETQLLQWPTAK